MTEDVNVFAFVTEDVNALAVCEKKLKSRLMRVFLIDSRDAV